jgi:hypothetical protein
MLKLFHEIVVMCCRVSYEHKEGLVAKECLAEAN